MRFKVPQNIDMPDRIVGPLTLTQFVYGVVGMGIAYIIYQRVAAPFGGIIAVPIAVFTAACTFVKIQEQPFLKFFGHFLFFVSAPQRRVWNQTNNSVVTVQITHQIKDEHPFSHDPTSVEDINRLAGKVDTSGKENFSVKN